MSRSIRNCRLEKELPLEAKLTDLVAVYKKNDYSQIRNRLSDRLMGEELERAVAVQPEPELVIPAAIPVPATPLKKEVRVDRTREAFKSLADKEEAKAPAPAPVKTVAKPEPKPDRK